MLSLLWDHTKFLYLVIDNGQSGYILLRGCSHKHLLPCNLFVLLFSNYLKSLEFPLNLENE